MPFAGAPVDVRVEIDDREALHLMALIESRGKKLPLRKIAVIGTASIARNFQAQGRPEPWAPIERSGMILQKTTALKKSVDFRLTPGNVEIYTELPYAPFQQFGTRFITPRPFVMWQDEDVGKIINVLRNHLTGESGVH